MRSKKVCLITANHIATHPRLVKEAIALEGAGYAVHLVFTQYDGVCSRLDQALLEQHPSWTYDVLRWEGNTLGEKLRRLHSGLVQKLTKRIFAFVGSRRLAPVAGNRHFYWQKNKALAAEADLYIAHGLGALPVACAAASRTGGVAGFDAEDFHRAETSDDRNNPDVRMREAIEDSFIPLVTYFTAASPLIGEAYMQLYGAKKPAVVLNVFPRLASSPGGNAGGRPVRLFWFSQTIGTNRGLEPVIAAMGRFAEGTFELHILGKSNDAVQRYFFNHAATAGLNPAAIRFHDTVPEAEIFRLAGQCDIGLAAETGIPLNRDLCLTNKIFTYIQAGLAVIASNTTAQSALLSQYPGTGFLYEQGNINSLVSALNHFVHDPEQLAASKLRNWALGQTELNWEREQAVFLAAVAKVCNGQAASSTTVLNTLQIKKPADAAEN